MMADGPRLAPRPAYIVNTYEEVRKMADEKTTTIVIRDVRTDGFPEDDEDCYFWSTDHGLIEGFPLIRPEPSKYGVGFVTLEKAMEDPAEVAWARSGGGGVFFDVIFWVPAAGLWKAFQL